MATEEFLYAEREMGLGADGDPSSGQEPVSRNREDGFRRGRECADPPPSFGVPVVQQCVHGIATPEENCRQRGGQERGGPRSDCPKRERVRWWAL